MAEYLRSMPLFAAFSDTQLGDLQRQGRLIEAEPGAFLFYEGDAAKGLFLVLEGSLEILKKSGGQDILIAHIPPGEFVGEISLLTGNPHGAAARVSVHSRLLHFDQSVFSSARSSPIIRLLLNTMAVRMRNTEAAIRQHERLSSLGKLAAGLAAELSGPASNSLSDARRLPAALDVSQALAMRVGNLGLAPRQIKYLNALQRQLITREATALRGDTRAECERALALWMEAHGIANPAVAEFVAAGLDAPKLDELLNEVGAGMLPAVVQWLDAMVNVVTLSRSLIACSTRISELINSVKAYTYMDQSPMQQVDIHEGLENTLIMLRHRLAEVQIVRDYDRALPRITVFGSEINQVWTHLIENAIVATNACGVINLRTWRETDWLVVEVADDGCGIPKQLQETIFQPVFAQKTSDPATGLGLETVRRIVVERHRGLVRFSSIPGDTRFQVYLPLKPA
jgi:signal transduction histidine kinase